jgi:uncharacterized membrane protein (UPF0182 family)
MEVILNPADVAVCVLISAISFTGTVTLATNLSQFLISGIAVAPFNKVVQHSKSLGRFVGSSIAFGPHLWATLIFSSLWSFIQLISPIHVFLVLDSARISDGITFSKFLKSLLEGIDQFST